MGAAAIMEEKCSGAAAAPASTVSAACSSCAGGGSGSGASGAVSHQAGHVASAAVSAAAVAVTGGALASAAVCRSPAASGTGQLLQQQQQPCCAASAVAATATIASTEDAATLAYPSHCKDAGGCPMEAAEDATEPGSVGSPDSTGAAGAAVAGGDASVDIADGGSEDEGRGEAQRQQLLQKLQQHPLFRDLQTALLVECIAAPCLPSALLCALPNDCVEAAGFHGGADDGRPCSRLSALAAVRRRPYESVSRAVVNTHARVERDIASLRPWTNSAGLLLERSYRAAVAAAECQRYAALLYNCHSEECKRCINAYYDCERLVLVQGVQRHLAQRLRDIGLVPTSAAVLAAAMSPTNTIAANTSMCEQVVTSGNQRINIGSVETVTAAAAAAAAAAAEGVTPAMAASGSTEAGHISSVASDNMDHGHVSDGSNRAISVAASSAAGALSCAHSSEQLLASQQTALHDDGESVHPKCTSASASARIEGMLGEDDSDTLSASLDRQQCLLPFPEAKDGAQQRQSDGRVSSPPPPPDLPLDLSCRLTLTSSGNCKPSVAHPRPAAVWRCQDDTSDHCHGRSSCNSIANGDSDNRKGVAGSGKEAAGTSAAALWQGAGDHVDVTDMWAPPARPLTGRGGGVKKRMLTKYSWESLAFAKDPLADVSAADSYCSDASLSAAVPPVPCGRVKPTVLAAVTRAGGAAFSHGSCRAPSTAAAAAAAAAARLGRNRATLDDVVAQCLSGQKQRKRRAASAHQQQQTYQRRKGLSGCWAVKAGTCSSAAGALTAVASAAAGSAAADAAAVTVLGSNGRLPSSLLSAVKLEPSVATAAFGSTSDYMRIISSWPAVHDMVGGAGGSTSVLESLKRVVNSVTAVPAQEDKACGSRWLMPSAMQSRAVMVATGECDASAVHAPPTSSCAGIVGGGHGSPPLMASPCIEGTMASLPTIASVPAPPAGNTATTGLCTPNVVGKTPGLHQPPAGKRYLSHHARLVLNDWFLKHIRRPYPTLSEKISLAQQCGISSAKVDTWFANKRNRTHNTRKLLPKYSRLVLLKSAAAATAAAAAAIGAGAGAAEVQLPSSVSPNHHT